MVAVWNPEHVWDQDCCSPSGSSFTDLTLAIRASSPKSAAAARMNYLDLLCPTMFSAFKRSAARMSLPAPFINKWVKVCPCHGGTTEQLRSTIELLSKSIDGSAC